MAAACRLTGSRIWRSGWEYRCRRRRNGGWWQRRRSCSSQTAGGIAAGERDDAPIAREPVTGLLQAVASARGDLAPWIRAAEGRRPAAAARAVEASGRLPAHHRMGYAEAWR